MIYDIIILNNNFIYNAYFLKSGPKRVGRQLTRPKKKLGRKQSWPTRDLPDELMKSVKHFKSNKSSGPDVYINELFVHGRDNIIFTMFVLYWIRRHVPKILVYFFIRKEVNIMVPTPMCLR